ncbi:MAG: prepilin-type N-terminal cleavage/methylation domain-containing protein [Phycisphaerae bacterium]|nr:prepilin-type N-terminal cleavage/methylation domain-containing protein [Phycisphaerae bacterium]
MKERALQKRQAFTLLELILVMVILSTVLAMAAPSLRGFFASRQTHDAAGQILSLIQLAGSQAVSQGATYRLNFETVEGTYWLTARQGGAFEELGTEFGRRFSLPRDTTVELTGAGQDAGLDYVSFTPQGTCTPATITLMDRRGEKVRLICPSATETFSIVEGDAL